MGSILLVRHGQAAFGSDDYDRLSQKGAAQAQLVGAELRRRGLPFALVGCGSLLRQRDAAAHALSALDGDCVVQEDPRWNEYDHVALFGGREPDQREVRAFQTSLDSALKEWVRAGNHGPVGATWPAFLERVTAALDDTARSLGKGGSTPSSSRRAESSPPCAACSSATRKTCFWHSTE